LESLLCEFAVSKGLYRFESPSDRDCFFKQPEYRFEFDSDNLDDPKSAASAFGVNNLTALPQGGEFRFETTFLEADLVDSCCCYVSVKVGLRFEYASSLDELKCWIEDHCDDLSFCARITCKGEDGLDGSEEEGFIWPWDN
jgi:hypothetical protein